MHGISTVHDLIRRAEIASRRVLEYRKPPSIRLRRLRRANIVGVSQSHSQTHNQSHNQSHTRDAMADAQQRLSAATAEDCGQDLSAYLGAYTEYHPYEAVAQASTRHASHLLQTAQAARWSTALRRAAQRGSTNEFERIWQEMLDQYPHCAKSSCAYWTDAVLTMCLDVCVANDWVEMTKLLLSKGARAAAARPRPKRELHRIAGTMSCLVTAVQWRSHGTLEVLLETKALMDKSSGNGTHLLALAASLGCDAVVRVLLQAKADINAYDFSSGSALDNAVSNGHPQVVRTLLSSKADVAGGGCGLALTAPIVQAAGKRRVGAHLVKLLLDAKASANVPKYWLATPLQQAAACGSARTVLVLLKARARVADTTECTKTTPWSRAWARGFSDVANLLSLHYTTNGALC